MAVAEARKMEKDEVGGAGPAAPAWLAGGLGWGPRKFGELKTFMIEVRGELKKVAWPSWPEVQSTTVVVILTTVFFGFYLFGTDLVFSRVLSLILR